MITPEIGLIIWQIVVFVLLVLGAYYFVKFFRLLLKYLQNKSN